MIAVGLERFGGKRAKDEKSECQFDDCQSKPDKTFLKPQARHGNQERVADKQRAGRIVRQDEQKGENNHIGSGPSKSGQISATFPAKSPLASIGDDDSPQQEKTKHLEMQG